MSAQAESPVDALVSPLLNEASAFGGAACEWKRLFFQVRNVLQGEEAFDHGNKRADSNLLRVCVPAGTLALEGDAVGADEMGEAQFSRGPISRLSGWSTSANNSKYCGRSTIHEVPAKPDEGGCRVKLVSNPPTSHALQCNACEVLYQCRGTGRALPYRNRIRHQRAVRKVHRPVEWGIVSSFRQLVSKAAN